MMTLCQKVSASAKITGFWECKIYSLKLQMGLYLLTKFKVSSVIITSFRPQSLSLRPPLLKMSI